MSKHEVANLACKILSIYIVVQGVNAISSMLSVSNATPNQAAPMGIVKVILPFIVLLIFGVLMWFFSDRLSKVMVKEGSQFNENRGIMADDLHNIAFSVLGLFFIGNSLPRLISLLTSLNLSKGVPDSTERILIGSIGIIVQLIMGIGIFLGSHGLVNFLNAIKSAGLKKENDIENK